MPTDETTNTPADRQKILDEIRRRAEEAESQRLDAEDSQVTGGADGQAPRSSPAPFPAPPSDTGLQGLRTAAEGRGVILRERFAIALDRGRFDKAAELLRGLDAIAPDDPELPRLRAKLESLQEGRRIASERKAQEAPPALTPSREQGASAPPAPSTPAASERRPAQEPAREGASSGRVPPSPPTPSRPPSGRPPEQQPAPSGRSAAPPPQRATRQEQMAFRRKVGGIMEQANALYQQEKYDDALARIEDVLKMDAENEEAEALKGQIGKAKRIAEMMRREEARRKAAAPAASPPPPAPSGPLTADRDPWGTDTSQPHHDVGFDLPPQEKGPVGPPKPSLMSRVARKVTPVELPIRSIVTFAAIGALAVIAYLVVESLVTAVVPGRQAILVLPPSVDPADTALNVIADGVTDDLIRELSQVPDLRVVNAVTAFGFRRSVAAPLVLARGMGTEVVFQWAIMRNADGIAYTGALLDSASGKARWTVRQTSSLRGLSGVHHDLTRSILQVLEVTPDPDLLKMLRTLPTDVPEAYDASIVARAMMRRPDLYPPETIVAAFEQAVRFDSTFADAQAGLGWALVLAYEANSTPTQSLLNRAAFCVQRAVAVGTKTSEVFRVWGMMEHFRGNFDKAEARLEEAAAVAPSDAEAQRRLAILLASRGKIDLAVKAGRQAAADDPGNAASWIALGSARLSKVFFRPEGKDDLRAAFQALDQGYRVARDRSEYASGMHADLLVYLDMHDRAMDVLGDRIARSRDSYVDLYKLGRIQQSAGRPKEEWQGTFARAREVLSTSLAASPDDPQALTSMALVETRLGAFKEATAAIRRALEIAPSDVDVMYGAAKVFAIQGDRDQAFDSLRKALARRYSLAQVLDMDFYNLRTDEQFIRTIKK